MKTIKRNLFTGILAGAAMLALLGSLTLLAQSTDAKAQASDQQAQPKAQPRMGRLAERLGLTPEQQKKLEEFRAARLKERQSFRTEMDKMRQEFRALREDPKADPTKVNAAIDRMFQLRAERAKEAFRDRSSLKSVFTAEQLEKIRGFRGMVRERLGFARHERLGRLAERRGQLRSRAWRRWRMERDREF